MPPFESEPVPDPIVAPDPVLGRQTVLASIALDACARGEQAMSPPPYRDRPPIPPLPLTVPGMTTAATYPAPERTESSAVRLDTLGQQLGYRTVATDVVSQARSPPHARSPPA